MFTILWFNWCGTIKDVFEKINNCPKYMNNWGKSDKKEKQMPLILVEVFVENYENWQAVVVT